MTILEDISRYPLQMRQLFEAKKSPLYAPLAELILASEQIATQAREPWEFKSLAQMGREEFIFGGSHSGVEPWLHFLQKGFAENVSHYIYHERREGLLFFVQDKGGKYRIARAGDSAYDFICRLRAENSVGDLIFAKPPTWAEELFLGYENFETFKLVCYEGWNDARFDLLADTVIRETWQRMGSIPGLIKDSDLADSAPEKPLLTTERNTLLLIIAALCDYSAINHKDRGAAAQIAKMTEEIGTPVSDDAIREALKKISNALESRKK